MGHVDGYYRKDGTYVQGHQRSGTNEGGGAEGILVLVLLAVFLLPAVGAGWAISRVWGTLAGWCGGVAVGFWMLLWYLADLSTEVCPDLLADGTAPPCTDVTDGVHSHPLVLTIAIALTAAAAWHVYHFHRENRSWKVSGPEISRAHDYFSNLVRVFSLHSDAVDALEDRLRELWPHAEHEWQLDTMRVVVELGHGLGRAKADLQMIIDALQQRQRPLVIFNLFQAAAPDFNGAELIAWLASNPIASALRHAGAGKELQALVDNYNEGENILFTAPSVNAAMVPFFPPAINSGELKDLKPPLPVHFVVPPLLSREDTTGYDRPPLASTAPQQPAAPSGPVLHTTCLICSRPLTDYDSMVRGVGPTCWNRL